MLGAQVTMCLNDALRLNPGIEDASLA